jgi:hypothetical protein
MLALLFKFQKVEDYEMRSIMDSDDVLIDDEVHKCELLTVFGFYSTSFSCGIYTEMATLDNATHVPCGDLLV